jgi:hypothetical protein
MARSENLNQQVKDKRIGSYMRQQTRPLQLSRGHNPHWERDKSVAYHWESAIQRIDAQEERFYTLDRSTAKKVYVGVVRSDGNKTPYLGTYADSKWQNNLLALAECNGACTTIG